MVKEKSLLKVSNVFSWDKMKIIWEYFRFYKVFHSIWNAVINLFTDHKRIFFFQILRNWEAQDAKLLTDHLIRPFQYLLFIWSIFTTEFDWNMYTFSYQLL